MSCKERGRVGRQDENAGTESSRQSNGHYQCQIVVRCSREGVLGFASHTVRVIQRKLTELVVPKAHVADTSRAFLIFTRLV